MISFAIRATILEQAQEGQPLNPVTFRGVTLIAQWLNVLDVVGATFFQRSNVVFGPNILITTIRPRWDLAPLASTSWT
jgi:hypothetical protein